MQMHFFNYRRLVLAVLDALMINVSIIAAFFLSSNGSPHPSILAFSEHVTVWVTPVVVLSCLVWGLYHRIWEFARAEAAFGIFAGVTTGYVIVGLVIFAATSLNYPLSGLVISWLLSMLFIGGSRFAWREMRRRWALAAAANRRQPVLIYGNGCPDGNLAVRIDYDPASPYRVVGYVVDEEKRSMVGVKVAGYRVLGTWTRLEKLINEFGIRGIIVGKQSLPYDKLKHIMRTCQQLELDVLRPQAPLELAGDTSAGRAIRGIRYDDIIGREARVQDVTLQVDYVSGKRVMVTGAGGSIGSEICRQLCRYHPQEIILLGRGENRIHQIYQELKARFPDIKFSLAICNFAIEDATAHVFAHYKPQVVFHAGAHKHVYLMEHNPVEAVRNNIFGTKILADIAEATKVEKFVFISTDKAVEPTTVMGATKRFGEEMLLARNNGKGNGKLPKTEFVVVRFGNVIGSSGSVLTIFERQWAAGYPLTVTHPDVDRFFMTVQEAAFLVLQAGALSHGGDLYVLDMGEPRKILDIAREFIELHGGDPDTPEAIEITGLSPGEKLHESLTNPGEELCATNCELVNQVCLRPDMATELEIESRLYRLHELCAARDVDGIREALIGTGNLEALTVAL